MMRGKQINGTGKERGITENGSDVLELNARFGEIRYRANVVFEVHGAGFLSIKGFVGLISKKICRYGSGLAVREQFNCTCFLCRFVRICTVFRNRAGLGVFIQKGRGK